MTINRKFFFEEVREKLFSNSLKQSQVEGIDAILDVWEADHRQEDDRWLAYMLATVYHETGRAMQPVVENLNYSAKRLLQVFHKHFNAAQAAQHAGKPEEIANIVYANKLGNKGPASGDGWKYRGRGLVQITGKANYEKYGIAGSPEDALNDVKAVEILFDGMINGKFTQKRLRDYFNPNHEDWKNAREIINPGDLEEKVGGYGRTFYAALSYTT